MTYLYEQPEEEFHVTVCDGNSMHGRISVKSSEIASVEDGLEWLDYEADMLARSFREDGVEATARVLLVRTTPRTGSNTIASCTVEHMPSGTVKSRRTYEDAHSYRPALKAAARKVGVR